MGFSRRTLLASAGLAGLAAAGIAMKVSDDSPLGAVISQAGGVTDPAPASKRPVIRVERVYSEARGREVELQFVLPPVAASAGLPMSILLHGLHGNARQAAFGGLPAVLTSAVARGSVPAFGFVAVDGGNHYWHENVPGDDPMGMLLNEVPRWLRARGFGEPFACTGVSMGGFGALLYGRRRAERGAPVGAVAAVAPGLLTSWTEMRKRGAFASEEQWASLDPMRHVSSLGKTPLGIWIGDRDRFVEGTRRFIADAKPVVGSVSPGGHDDEYYRTVTPDVVRFLGRYAKRAV